MREKLAYLMGQLMYLRDNERDYSVRVQYDRKIKAIDVLLSLAPNEEKLISQFGCPILFLTFSDT